MSKKIGDHPRSWHPRNKNCRLIQRWIVLVLYRRTKKVSKELVCKVFLTTYCFHSLRQNIIRLCSYESAESYGSFAILIIRRGELKVITHRKQTKYMFILRRHKQSKGRIIESYDQTKRNKVMNIWKSYTWTAEWRIIWKKIMAVIYATYAVAKRKPEKFQACTGFEPLTCTGIAPVQYRCTGISEVKGSNPVQAWIFFQAFFSQLHKLHI